MAVANILLGLLVAWAVWRLRDRTVGEVMPAVWAVILAALPIELAPRLIALTRNPDNSGAIKIASWVGWLGFLIGNGFLVAQHFTLFRSLLP